MKKVYISLCLSLAMSAIGLSTQAQQSLWQEIPTHYVPTTLKQYVFPTQYTAFRIDLVGIQEKLSKAGTSFQAGIDLILPLGDQTQVLRVWRDDVLPPELAAKFPEIQSYTAVDPNNHAISAKLDLNIMGFSAMIIHPEYGTYMIDPYSLKSNEYYVGFWRKDLDPNIYNTGFCGTKDEFAQPLLPTSENLSLPNIDTRQDNLGPMSTHGSQRRTYRAAISCTGEWAYMITGGAPSIPGVLSAIATIINRCNGVFQRELSIKLELIPTNNEIIYIDPGSDPYTCVGESHECLINQVQDNLNAVYPGGVGYDIGHIFCSTGGGLAQVGVVCRNSKAKGVSGVFSTSDIGTIIHEMGHQLSASHTFNSASGGCEGNGSVSTAYEPGSGTSIMSYNGLCDPDNIPAPDIDFYHYNSLKSITDYINTSFGGTCGITSPGVPPITIHDLPNDTFRIPTYTPFELFAEEPTTYEPATPAVTFSWEQYDLGNYGQPEAISSSWGEGPTFSSLAPSVRRDRQFPHNLLTAANNYEGVGDRLSLGARLFTFRLTNRSYFEGWGTVNLSDDLVVVEVVGAAPFRVTGPSTSVLYEVGQPIPITWNPSTTVEDPIGAHLVNIYMSINGGLTYPFLVAANVPNSGSFNLPAPNVYSDEIRFKVKASNNIFYDVSKTSVKIHGDPLGVGDATLAKQLKVYPNPADNILHLRSEVAVTYPLQVRMVNMLGQVVYTGSFTQNLDIDVSGFAAGNYLVQIVEPVTGQSTSEKVVIK